MDSRQVALTRNPSPPGGTLDSSCVDNDEVGREWFKVIERFEVWGWRLEVGGWRFGIEI